jgi:hypothetical protein
MSKLQGASVADIGDGMDIGGDSVIFCTLRLNIKDPYGENADYTINEGARDKKIDTSL